MEDSEAIELIQRAIVRDGRENSFLEFGGLHADLDRIASARRRSRAFWRYYAGPDGAIADGARRREVTEATSQVYA